MVNNAFEAPASEICLMLATNQHIHLFQDLGKVLFATYRVRARFDYEGYHGSGIWVNNQQLVWRPKKVGDFSLGENVRVISHNLSHMGGGSNKYPRLGEKGSYCVLEFTTHGLPTMELRGDWRMHVLSLTKIETNGNGRN